MKPNDDSFSRANSQNGYRREYATMESFAASIIKVITLRRRGNTPLGFSIRGGWEHGTGVFVSEVVPGSLAQKQGLRVGDQIIRINGFSIHRAIHMEVLSLLKTCPGIILKIKRVGILPVKERDKDPVTWKIVEPPPTVILPDQVTHSRVNGSTLENIIVKIEINVPGSSSLGCRMQDCQRSRYRYVELATYTGSIAKGPPEMPGIFMCTVKEGGIADQAGLQVGDQILEMNGTGFHDLKLNEAVALMKSAKDIRLTVKKGAGITLFLDNGSSSHLSGSNKNDDCISTTRSISDGISKSPSSSQKRVITADAFTINDFDSEFLSTTLKDREFSGSCSSKSEGSSFQSSVSSDSEKDYSISEESAFEGLPKTKWTHLHHHKKNPSTSTTEDDSWILEEKRNLEEGRRQLAEEKRRLEEERRKLELEKTSSSSSSQPTSLEETSSRENSFLNELQKAAARMNTKENRERMIDPIKNGINKDIGKVKRCKEDAIKRMQHEMLMEEFREAHRKMFGSQAVLNVEENGEHNEHDEQKEPSPPPPPPIIEFSKLTLRNKKHKPPPPPPKLNGESIKECQKITVNGQVPGVQNQMSSQPEDTIPSVKDIIKETEKSLQASVPPANGFRVTVTDKGRNPERGFISATAKGKTGTLVEVTPWTTRL